MPNEILYKCMIVYFCYNFKPYCHLNRSFKFYQFCRCTRYLMSQFNCQKNSVIVWIFEIYFDFKYRKIILIENIQSIDLFMVFFLNRCSSSHLLTYLYSHVFVTNKNCKSISLFPWNTCTSLFHLSYFDNSILNRIKHYIRHNL